MRVALAVPTEDLWSQQLDRPGLREMRRAFWVFSIAVLLLATVTWVLLLGIPIVVLALQLAWGKKQEREERT
jgi:Flp pilus assembly protein TadB